MFAMFHVYNDGRIEITLDKPFLWKEMENAESFCIESCVFLWKHDSGIDFVPPICKVLIIATGCKFALLFSARATSNAENFTHMSFYLAHSPSGWLAIFVCISVSGRGKTSFSPPFSAHENWHWKRLWRASQTTKIGFQFFHICTKFCFLL